MNVYVDSSVLLRIVLNEPGALREWHRIERAVASEVIRLECRRTIDRARIRHSVADETVAQWRSELLALLDGFDIVPLDSVVLERAAEPFPTLLGSLDAIHLASAVLARDHIEDLSFATHDGELAIAARAMGFGIMGISRGGRKRPR